MKCSVTLVACVLDAGGALCCRCRRCIDAGGGIVRSGGVGARGLAGGRWVVVYGLERCFLGSFSSASCRMAL